MHNAPTSTYKYFRASPSANFSTYISGQYQIHAAMKVKLSFWIFLIFTSLQAQDIRAQLNNVQFDQLDSLQKVLAKTMVVFIHTDWCKYCQMMENTTFKNERIIRMLNEQFYFIKLNGEEREDIVFNGHVFKYQPTGIHAGSHELAEQLARMDKRLVFPTITFLNVKHEIIFQHNQYIDAKDLETILVKLK